MTGHKERLLKYLQQNGKITTIEAIQKLRNKGELQCINFKEEKKENNE